MATVRQIYEYIDSFAPFSYQESWDNSGILVGGGGEEVKRALLTLDISREAAEEAKSLGCELVITHHPVIFTPLKALRQDNPACMLLRMGIACISAHTNLDCADYGISSMICSALGLSPCREVLIPTGKLHPCGRSVGFGEIGAAQSITPEELIDRCKRSFNSVCIKFVRGERSISRVGILSGAGGEGVELALEHGLDAVVTSEIKQHQLVMARDIGITAVDIGHYESEAIAMPWLRDRLLEGFSDTEFILTKTRFPAESC